MADEDMNLSNGTPLNISNASSSNSKEDKPPQNNGDATDWKLYDKVMVRWKDGVCYEAKIIKISADENGQLSYRLTYSNWGKTYDETYSHEQALEIFEDYSPEYAKECKREYNKRLTMESGGKKRKASKASFSDVTPSSKRLAIALPRGSLSSSAPVQTPESSPPVERSQSFKTPTNVRRFSKLKLSTRESSPSFSEHDLSEAKKLFVPNRLRDLALKKCVFPPKLPISDLTKAYIEETKTGRRPTSSLGEYAGRIESVIDCMVNDCKTTVPFYLLEEEFPAYFELVNKIRADRDPLNIDDYARKGKESKDFPDSQGSFRQIILQKKIPEKYQPDESALDLVYLLRYVITFGNIVDPTTSSYQGFEPIFTDLLDFIDAALPEDVYE